MRRIATPEEWTSQEKLFASLCTAAGGIATAAGILGWTNVALSAAGVLLVAAAFCVFVALPRWWAEGRRERMLLARQRRVPISLASKVDPTEIGVDPAAKQMLPGGEVPEYIPRTADAALEGALRGALTGAGSWLVIVQGPAKVGKSRTAFEGLRRLCDEGEDLRLVAPTDAESLRSLLEQVGVRRRSKEQPVLWLDDLETFVRDGVDLKALSAWHDSVGAVVVATYGGKGSERPSSEGVAALADRILASASRVGLQATSAAELARLPEGISESDRKAIEDYGLAAALVAADALEIKLETGLHQSGERHSPEGVAVVHAAIDWALGGRTDPVPREQLRAIWAERLPEGVPPSDDTFKEALDWALRPVAGLIALLSETGASSFQPYDFIVGSVAATQDLDSLSETAWRLVLDTEDPGQALEVGISAYFAGRVDDAEKALTLAGTSESSEIASAASVNLGVLLMEKGENERAKEAFRRAMEMDNPAGANNLGLLLQEEPGGLDAAEAAFRQAIEMGDLGGAWANLGALLDGRGKPKQAEEAFREAAAREIVAGFLGLGLLLRSQGRAGEAEPYFREAAERGSSKAKRNLAGLLMERGERAEARPLLREAAEEIADELDEERPLLLLIHFLEEEGDSEGLRDAYREAMDLGDGEMAGMLGQMLKREGEIAGAKDAYRRGAELGNPDAASNLGVLLQDEGDLDGAEAAYRRAIELDSGSIANFNLRGLFEQREEEASRKRGVQ
jgi:tetratricopeptide (TPR) repeat protein